MSPQYPGAHRGQLRAHTDPAGLEFGDWHRQVKGFVLGGGSEARHLAPSFSAPRLKQPHFARQHKNSSPSASSKSAPAPRFLHCRDSSALPSAPEGPLVFPGAAELPHISPAGAESGSPLCPTSASRRCLGWTRATQPVSTHSRSRSPV